MFSFEKQSKDSNNICTIRQKSFPHSVFLTHVLSQYRGVSDRPWHNSLSVYYIDKESCHRLSDSPHIDGLFGLIAFPSAYINAV